MPSTDPQPMKAIPKAKRVTVIVEVGDQVEAWQAELPEEVAVRFDREEPRHFWHDEWRFGPQSPKIRFGIDVECGDSGCVVASRPETVAKLLERVVKPAHSTAVPEGDQL